MSDVINGFRDEVLHTLRRVLSALPDEQYVSIEVKEIKHPTESRRRSDRQNRYLHGVVIPMVRDRLLLQNMPLEAKQAMTHDNVLRIVKIAAGISHLIPLYNSPPVHLEGRSSKLTPTEFMDFVIKIQEWAARVLDIQIPDPQEAGYDLWAIDNLNREGI